MTQHFKESFKMHKKVALDVHLKVLLSVQSRTPLRAHLKICLMVYFEIYKDAQEVYLRLKLRVDFR